MSRPVNIFGIETSCDETAAAVVTDGRHLRSNIVASQMKIHAAFGGVVPEVAARAHIGVMLPVVEQALAEAQLDWEEIDGIAVTYGPGLIGSLLVGTLTAHTLALLKNKPLIPVDHVAAHPYAAFLDGQPPRFPLLALIVSGGHTQLVLYRDHQHFEVVGRTHDDAVGEAFDKVAKVLGLPYPGGPAIAAAAQQGDAAAYQLPRPKLANRLDFSFSGLKTAVLRTAQTAIGGDFRTPSTQIAGQLTAGQRNDLAASFQAVAVQILADQLAAAYQHYRPAAVIVAGGVAANKALRDAVERQLPRVAHFPPLPLCTDNAAMIASRGFFTRPKQPQLPPLPLRPDPILTM